MPPMDELFPFPMKDRTRDDRIHLEAGSGSRTPSFLGPLLAAGTSNVSEKPTRNGQTSTRRSAPVPRSGLKASATRIPDIPDRQAAGKAKTQEYAGKFRRQCVAGDSVNTTSMDAITQHLGILSVGGAGGRQESTILGGSLGELVKQGRSLIT